MGLDVRLPLGLLFALIGALLVARGLFADAAMNARSLGININLWWGLIMVAFGAATLLFSRWRSDGRS